jgi:phosphoribosyl 1,2-cyclic phosphate phosphodiesterase
LRVTFLGTGTSFGVPVIGCHCPACSSDDPRDRRTRHSLLIEQSGHTLLVDTPPELRLQLVRAGVERVDAVFLSHEHADHTHGIDDLRVFSMRAGAQLPLYVAREFEPELKRRFSYIWQACSAPNAWSTVPDLELCLFEDREPVDACGIRLLPIAFPHGVYRSFGFRAGDLAVVVDGKSVPEDAIPLLEGVRALVINALWFGDPHPGHFSIEEAIEVGRRLGAEMTYLTHLTHRVVQTELDARLPPGIRAAYDGLTVEV